ncbi:MAG: Calx-beta domain-containing protein, partial [Cyanobacteria bacterium P01_F01_bin.150]
MSQNNSSYVEFAQFTYLTDEILAGQPSQVGLTLRRTGNLDRFDEVQIVPTDGEASLWSDFTINNEFVQFNPGEVSKTIILDILPDGLAEGTESIAFELLSNSGTLIGPQNTATVEIKDADVSYVEFAQAVYQGAENNESPEPAQLLVTLTRSGALNMPADVEVQVTPDSAMEGMDYSLPFGAPISVFFEAWQRTQTIAIDIFGDGQFEGTESIDLELISLYGPTEIGPQSTARVDIIDAEAGYVEFAQAN